MLRFNGRSQRRRTISAAVAAVFLCGSLVSDELSEQRADTPDFEKIFDGESLEGWTSVPSDRAADWVVKEGVISGMATKSGLAYLVFADELEDFELRLSYRLPMGGNSGIELRARPDESGKRPLEGYHADLGHVGIGRHILGAWDLHFADRNEPAGLRGTHLMIRADGSDSSKTLDDAGGTDHIRQKDWNDVRIVAEGNSFSFFINDRLMSKFTDNFPSAFRRGKIALQLHDKGKGADFRNVRLKRLSISQPQ